jgi:hypothetical protein
MPTLPSVVQPSFAPGRASTAPPGGALPGGAPVPAQKPPHPAMVAQPKLAFGSQAEKPPHPAMVAQPKLAFGSQAEKPPHPAMVAQPKLAFGSQAQKPPHPAMVAQPKLAFGSQAQKPPHPAMVSRSAPSVQPAMGGSASPAPPGFLSSASWDQGQVLPQTVQRSLSGSFGDADFSAVRIHEGRDAEMLGALAFTAGESIYFARGQYQPETRPGQELLRKQLAFVLQQRAGRVKNPFGSGVAVVRDPALEAEAAQLAGR